MTKVHFWIQTRDKHISRRHNMHRHWGFQCKHEKALGHICTVATAMAIQNDGFIKAQTSPDRKTENCYFIDFRDCVSMLKGLSSLWKHIKGLGPQTRYNPATITNTAAVAITITMTIAVAVARLIFDF